MSIEYLKPPKGGRVESLTYTQMLVSENGFKLISKLNNNS